MICRRPGFAVSVFAAMLFSAATAHADDSVAPERVVMTENPLTTEQAQAAQKAWADHIGFDVAFENSIGMQLRVIPPGTFRMSSRRVDESQTGPVEVTLSQAFLIGQFEVTQGEWERVMGPIEGNLDAGAGDRFPAYRVNHADVSEFCRKLTQLELKAGKLPNGYEYRLPTAAEWGFACRAGTLTRYPFGESMNSRLANYDGTQPYRDTEKGPFLGRTAEVGSYPANAWGLHDMLGNVTEWCLDWYHHKVDGGVDPAQLQRSPLKIPGRVIRGGAWRSPGKYCHTANRYHSKPEGRHYIGFRPVLTKIIHVAADEANSTQSATEPKPIVSGTPLAAGKINVPAASTLRVANPAPVLMTEHALSTEKAQTAQKAWADHLGLEVFVENSIGMQLCLIPPGTFPMSESKRNRPVVTHSSAYLIGRYEVTQGEWERVMGRLPSQLVHGKGDRFPVYRITYAEASEFCRKLTGLDREAGKLPEGYEYRLPTDAEWEYACRAGTLTATYFGDSLSSSQANFDGSKPFNGAEEGPNLARTAEVGSYPANAWGLHDMHGNLCEWALDWYHPKPKGGVDPVQLTPAPKRVLRDGRHSSLGQWCRSANRYYMDPKVRPGSVGVRPVLTKLQHDSVEPERAEPKRVLMNEHALSTEQAQAAQKAWADQLGVDAVVENSIGMQLCVIPPGTLPMGSPKGEANRKPGELLHEMTHTQPFFIGRYEVTQAEWERVMGKIKEPLKFGSGDRYPVYRINHAEASEFCRKLTQLDREAGRLPKGYEYRLPTDAEWEYACRAGTLTATYFGNKVSSRQANFDGRKPYNGAEKGPNLGRTAEVGSYPANAWGLHDMHGNLSEWCVDWYHERPKGGVDPVQLTPALKRVIRDARHGNPGFYCRSANRYYAPENERRNTVGFRPLLTKLHLDE